MQEQTVKTRVQMLERDVEQIKSQVMKMKVSTFPNPDRQKLIFLVKELEGQLSALHYDLET